MLHTRKGVLPHNHCWALRINGSLGFHIEHFASLYEINEPFTKKNVPISQEAAELRTAHNNGWNYYFPDITMSTYSPIKVPPAACVLYI